MFLTITVWQKFVIWLLMIAVMGFFIGFGVLVRNKDKLSTFCLLCGLVSMFSLLWYVIKMKLT